MRVFLAGLFAVSTLAVLIQVASAQQPRPEGRRPANPLVTALDADGDGSISKEELANAVEALKKLDKNGDGVLSGDEIRPAFGGGGRPGGGDGRPGAGGPGGGNPEQFIARILEADKNGDGKISKEEAPDRMKDRFDRIDANKDGFLDKDELKTMAGRFGGGRPGGGDRPARRPEGARARPEAEKKP